VLALLAVIVVLQCLIHIELVSFVHFDTLQVNANGLTIGVDSSSLDVFPKTSANTEITAITAATIQSLLF
jgi:hypothetical protein